MPTIRTATVSTQVRESGVLLSQQLAVSELSQSRDAEIEQRFTAGPDGRWGRAGMAMVGNEIDGSREEERRARAAALEKSGLMRLQFNKIGYEMYDKEQSRRVPAVRAKPGNPGYGFRRARWRDTVGNAEDRRWCETVLRSLGVSQERLDRIRQRIADFREEWDTVRRSSRPAGPGRPRGPWLGAGVKEQRALYNAGNLQEERKQKLISIGSIFDGAEAKHIREQRKPASSCKDKFPLREQHGHTCVPKLRRQSKLGRHDGTMRSDHIPGGAAKRREDPKRKLNTIFEQALAAMMEENKSFPFQSAVTCPEYRKVIRNPIDLCIIQNRCYGLASFAGRGSRTLNVNQSINQLINMSQCDINFEADFSQVEDPGIL